jgi:hypothetical protein
MADRRGRPPGSRLPQSLRPGDSDDHRARGGSPSAPLETGLALDSIGFRWTGCDEGDQVEGEGTTELLEDGSIEIEFAAENSFLVPCKEAFVKTPDGPFQPGSVRGEPDIDVAADFTPKAAESPSLFSRSASAVEMPSSAS